MRTKEAPLTASILMVDDRVENLVALEGILEPLGHPLVRAPPARKRSAPVLLQDFAVILLDVQMPGMNGFETANFIKSRERSRHTPIIFLTAISKDEEYVFEGYSVGAVDYMFKPFNPDVLRSKVAVFVDLYLKGQQLRRQAEKLRESERRELELRHRVRLGESEARFANIVESARDAIISFTDDRRITLFNSAAEEIFGFAAAEALDRPVDELLRFAGGDEHAPKAGSPPTRDGDDDDRPAPHGPPTRETVGRRASGEEFPVELSLSTLDASEERVHTVILRDISERRRGEETLRAQAISLAQSAEELRVLNEELSERTTELEQAIGARSRFYASMSHELRTPINAILGYTSLLIDEIFGPLTEKQAASLERTHKAADHLLELVNDVLDLSKIEAGKMELQIETVGFPELIEDLFVTVSPFAEQHGAELKLETESDPFTIVSDARRVRQILLNLLSNGIKFGGGRPVQVVWNRGEDGGARVSVTDQGGGIAPEDQERIFEEFVQLDQQEGAPGTGLGLPISRRLAELLGGSLTVTSVPGEGSTFNLSLPPVEMAVHEGESREVLIGR
jgi:PAS domain S-box-containing protein